MGIADWPTYQRGITSLGPNDPLPVSRCAPWFGRLSPVYQW